MSIPKLLMHKNAWMIYAILAVVALGWTAFQMADVKTQLAEKAAGYERLYKGIETAKWLAEKHEARAEALAAAQPDHVEDVKNYILANYRTVAPVIATEIANRIVEYSEKYSLPLELMVGAMERESHFNPFAVSPLKNDPGRGLMQVRFKVHGKELGLTDRFQLHDVNIGIDSGARVLQKYLIKNKNNVRKALFNYVGAKNNKATATKYINDVYKNMGKFSVFRALVNRPPTKDETVAKIENPKAYIRMAPVKPDTFDGVEFDGADFESQETADKAKAARSYFVHKVTHRGETLGLIAQWYTGKVNNWYKIQKLNPNIIPEKMAIGAEILIDPAMMKRDDKLTKEYVASV